ncbi:FkbM family methyltransferase [Mucilaginibacter terrenus]|uniref:FkbM family methyltransferase n=1 Tax=Mucilaginibacter terrenus TaxID=2482727 RepID=A0A3E2NW30_9SPHI|nr:FkbM family methyltransferase [Mucilaginibacter terrenus]RFZ85215.1 FkbM family methyltransferase [Mucilaginibacter terrenus]
MDSEEHVISALLRKFRPEVDVVTACRHLKAHDDYPSLLSISETFKAYAIDNAAYNWPFERLHELPLPFITYVTTHNGEYMIVTEINDREVFLTSRNSYEVPMLLDSFKLIFEGTVLVLEPPEPGTALAIENTQPSSLIEVDDLPFQVTYVDIGASYGLPPKWERFAQHPNFMLLLIEPDAGQAADIRLQYPNAMVLETGLSNLNEERDINITASQSCSSVLEPNMDVLRRFNLEKWFTVIGSTKANLRRFEQVAAETGLHVPDFIKIDVQGFEYEVLEGFGKLLDQVLCIELETHLLQIYKEQKLFFDIHKMLYHHGFFLRHLEQTGSFLSEAVEFNAYFVRNMHGLHVNAQAKITFWEAVNNLPPAKTPRA